MWRRQRLSHDSRNFHEHSPQKKRTYNAAPNYFNNSIYHGNLSTTPQRQRGEIPQPAGVAGSWLRPQAMKPKSGAYELENTVHNWIGRRIIYHGHHLPANESAPMRGMPGHVRYPGLGADRLGTYITEDFIAKHAKPNMYRILFMDSSPGNQFSINVPGVRNKVSVGYNPGRMNIFVDETDIIRGVDYF